MKYYFVRPPMPSMFFYKGYEFEHPDLYYDSLKGFEYIYQKEHLQNGLLKISNWQSAQILSEWKYIFVSEELKNMILEKDLLEIDKFIPIAYGWSSDPETEILPLPKFYLLDLAGKGSGDHFCIYYEDYPREKLCVSESALKLILLFKNERLDYEEFV